MEVLTPSGNKTNLVSVSWSPDGQQLVAGGADGTIKIWTTLRPGQPR